MERELSKMNLEAFSIHAVGAFGRVGKVIISAATEPAVKAKATKLKNRLLTDYERMVNRVEIAPGVATNLAGESLLQITFWGSVVGSAAERAVMGNS